MTDNEVRNMLRSKGLCGKMLGGTACVGPKGHDKGLHEQGWTVTSRVDADPNAKDSRETITTHVISDGVRRFKASAVVDANWLADVLNAVETR